MAEKITYGISNVKYAQKTENAEGVPIYGALKRWDGATELAMPPMGDPIKVYADNVVYFKRHANQGYEGNLNVYQVPEDFRLSHLGEYKDANGVLIEKSNAVPLDFALIGEFMIGDSDAAVSSGKRFALYNCSAGRPDFGSTTKQEGIEPVSMSVPITAAPTISDEIVKATIKKDDNEEIYNAWFDSVYYNPSSLAVFTVTVTVTAPGTPSASPVAGAVVVIGGKVGVTNSSGIAKIALPNGTYDIAVMADGHDAELSTVTVSSAAANVSVTLT